MSPIDELIQDARPVDDYDWGSDRQIDAENRLSEAVLTCYGRDLHEEWVLASVNHKMTTEDYLDWIQQRTREMTSGTT